MAEYLPKFKPGEAITIVATGAITGGLMTTVAGVTAGANAADWLGVASRDAVSGTPVGVYTESVQRPVAAGAIAAGALVKCAAAGQVKTFVVGTDTHDRLVGIALEAGTTGNPFAVKFAR